MHLNWENILFVLYLLAGPGAWLLFAIGMHKGKKRINLLVAPNPAPDPPPKVTILIPAKDEGERIRACLSSALNQDYPHFEVIAIDDRSGDCTGTVMDEMAVADARLRVVHIPHGPVPEGWTGKNNALHTAVQQASGDWFLFVDSDVILDPDALSRTLALAISRNFDLVSLMPRLECHTFWESLIVPLAGTALSGVYTVPGTNSRYSPKLAFANGQYMLFRRGAYEQIGGHAAVRGQFCEDIEIARIMKRMELRPRISWGMHLAAVRMYDSLPGIMRGWARIFYAGDSGRPWRILAGIAYVLLSCYSVYAAFAWVGWRMIHPDHFGFTAWLAAAIIHWLIMTLCLAVSYAWTTNPKRNALYFPLGGIFLLGILVRALKMCFTRKVEWRGTHYTQTMKT
jgi:glycosyltransferase involved in cell wall biosynthesis